MAVVETCMNFLPPWKDDAENPYLRSAPNEGFAKSNFGQREYPVKIIDARPKMMDFGLDTHGFEYHKDLNVGENLLQAIRSSDSNTVVHEYLQSVEKLVREKTGAGKVVIFDHTVRRRELDSTARFDGQVKANRAMQPASLVSRNQQEAIKRVYTVVYLI